MRVKRSVILVAGRDLALLGGGHPNYVMAHALAASAAGFAPQVFCAARRSEVVRTEYGTLRRVRTPGHFGYRNEPLQRPLLARAIARHVERSQPAGPVVLHSFGHWAATGVRVAALLARRGIEAVTVASAYTTLAHENAAKVAALGRHHSAADQLRYRRDHLWVRAVAGRAELKGYERSTLVLVNYESVLRIVAEACHPRAARVFPYAPMSAFRDNGPVAPAPGPPHIVSVARHDPRKGLSVLLRALAGLKADGVAFRATLVGIGPLLDTHRRLVANLGLGAQVELVGFVDDVFDRLRQAHVFVLPSLEEGSGSIALLEALQAGLPVVASRCDGIPEDVDQVLVAPGDVADLRAALARVLADSSLRRRLGEHSRATFERRFSAERLTGALGELYSELEARRPGAETAHPVR
jgi:glycosyltransferase involved in cell wall biosynthesis